MLLPFVFVTVGIATFDISCTKRCTTVIVLISLADVMAKMADGFAMFIIGRLQLNYNWNIDPVANPSATLAITSAIHTHGGHSINHQATTFAN